ncbi:MAG: hypothetical protein ACM3UU_07905 [Ignavibacteriales bacterium]
MGDIFKKYIEKIPGVKQGNKKVVEYLIIFIIIGILLILISNFFGSSDGSSSKKDIVYSPAVQSQKAENELNFKLEQRLAKILSEIRGVGRVSVIITYSSGPESVLAREEKNNQTNTNERDSTGGERKTIQNNIETSYVMADEQSGTKKPVVVRQMASKIQGVVIAAEGGDNSTVKADIVSAVEAATGISGYRIRVFKKN